MIDAQDKDATNHVSQLNRVVENKPPPTLLVTSHRSLDCLIFTCYLRAPPIALVSAAGVTVGTNTFCVFQINIRYVIQSTISTKIRIWNIHVNLNWADCFRSVSYFIKETNGARIHSSTVMTILLVLSDWYLRSKHQHDRLYHHSLVIVGSSLRFAARTVTKQHSGSTHLTVSTHLTSYIITIMSGDANTLLKGMLGIQGEKVEEKKKDG